MPTYVYACKNCGHRFEKYQSFSEDSLTECPDCGESTLRKVFDTVGVVFKGSGFYSTDAKSSGANTVGASSGSSSEGSGSSSDGGSSAAAASSGSSSSSAAGGSSSSSSSAKAAAS